MLLTSVAGDWRITQSTTAKEHGDLLSSNPLELEHDFAATRRSRGVDGYGANVAVRVEHVCQLHGNVEDNILRVDTEEFRDLRAHLHGGRPSCSVVDVVSRSRFVACCVAEEASHQHVRTD